MRNVFNSRPRDSVDKKRAAWHPPQETVLRECFKLSESNVYPPRLPGHRELKQCLSPPFARPMGYQVLKTLENIKIQVIPPICPAKGFIFLENIVS